MRVLSPLTCLPGGLLTNICLTVLVGYEGVTTDLFGNFAHFLGDCLAIGVGAGEMSRI